MTIRKGSIYWQSKLALDQHIDIIYCFAVLNCSVKRTARLAGCCEGVITKWTLVLRKCISFWWADNHRMLGTMDIIVEVDETCMTQKKKYNVGNVRRRSRWVLGMQERGTHRKRHIYLGQRRTRAVILPVIQRHIAPGARIMTDNFRAYWTLPDHGFIHGMVNHSIEFVNEYNPEIHTETVEGGFSHMKKGINYGMGVRDWLLQLHLDEHDFRSTYLDVHPERSFAIMGRLLARYGARALEWVLSRNAHFH